jgi:hypothetical protein
MKAVAGPKREAGRLSGRKGVVGWKKRQADRCNMAGRSMQSSRDRGRQAERGRQERQAGREAGGCRGRQAGAITQECRQMSREGIR